MIYRCTRCLLLIQDEHVPEGKCPVCQGELERACQEDHPCRCGQTIHAGFRTCPTCGGFICPCGSHDVAVLSRVTGYLQEVGGWNAGKRQELNDRHRVDL